MKSDLPGTVRTIARFIGCQLDEATFARVVHQSSLPFMQAHKQKFDDHFMRLRSEQVCGLPPGSDSSKVRTGRVGEHVYELPPEISAELDSIWQEEIEARFGYPSYAALRQALAQLPEK
jgi:hypothetical protein